MIYVPLLLQSFLDKCRQTDYNPEYNPRFNFILQLIDIKDACCKDVLIYVAEGMDKDWQQFLMVLTNNHSLIQEMQSYGKSGRENVMDYFQSIAFQLKWSDLKATLHNMEKQSIVNHIEKNFLYTRGKIDKLNFTVLLSS